MAYNFHYTPTGTGVISGKEVLEQTEDAINDLGNTAISGVQEALDKAEQALTNSANAVDDAQTALNTANNADENATTALNTVNNLSGTVTSLGNRVTTAEGNITNLQGRMTTAESGISGLNTRMGTAEGNITTLQSNVSTAQATANSAQQTANTARQQSYVLRYSSSSVTDNSTIAYSTIDNTDNIKVNDKIIDVDGKIFSVVSVDTANQTVTVGSALIDLALDANVVHTSGNETVGGQKTFNDRTIFSTTTTSSEITLKQNAYDPATSGQSTVLGTYNFAINARTVTNGSFGQLGFYGASGFTTTRLVCRYYTDPNVYDETYVEYSVKGTSGSITSRAFIPSSDNLVDLGGSTSRWKGVYATNYYYGSSNTEFSDKFVTTDTNQSISGEKTFSDNLTIYNSDVNSSVKNLSIKNQNWVMAEVSSVTQTNILFTDKNGLIPVSIIASKGINGESFLRQAVRTKDVDDNIITEELYFYIAKSGLVVLRPWHDNVISLGTSSQKWKDVQTNLVNGLTPSSLCMPASSGSVNISGYITDLSGGNNTYTPLENGFVYIDLQNASNLTFATGGISKRHYLSSGTYSRIADYIHVRSGEQVVIICSGTLRAAVFIPCQGNV